MILYNKNYYYNLIHNYPKNIPSKFEYQIELDLGRTYPNDPFFKEPKNIEINSVPFKSLVKEEPPKIINSSANVNNIISSANVVNPFCNRFTGSTYKIELFKSPNQSSLMNKVQVITLNPSKKNQENYKLLIKRIAAQLRKKIHPPTKGFFYKCIKTFKTYMTRVFSIVNMPWRSVC